MAESIFIDEMSINHNEDMLINELGKKHFYECLDFYDYKVENVLTDKVFTEQKEQFNFVIRKIKENFDIDILTSILFLEKDFMSMHNILKILDDSTKYELKLELGKKHNKKINTSFLKFFFE
jgi:predicted nucleotide-binding protein (sugar kinase/HSP70/actin superfamily)